jgi:hypothetical protein
MCELYNILKRSYNDDKESVFYLHSWFFKGYWINRGWIFILALFCLKSSYETLLKSPVQNDLTYYKKQL